MTTTAQRIHIAAKRIGLDEETLRAKMMNLVGESRASKMTEAQRAVVLASIEGSGSRSPSVRRPNGRTVLSGKFVKKAQALWIAGYNLGVIHNRDDAAMCKFIFDQTGIESAQWLHHAKDARSVIEALKAWLNRERKVGFGKNAALDWLSRDGAKIAWAQWRLIMPGADLIIRKGFDDAVRSILGRDSSLMLDQVSDRDWIPVMNNLGKRVRAMKGDV